MSEIIIREKRHRDTAINFINNLDQSKIWKITIVRYVKRRSLSQNAMLHGWFGIIADEIGDDMESVKADFKRMFLPLTERVSPLTGEVTMEPRKTSDLNTAEMSEFCDKILAFAGSILGIFLPVPEDFHERTV